MRRHVHPTNKVPAAVRFPVSGGVTFSSGSPEEEEQWSERALAVFARQRDGNPVYRRWLELTGRLDLAPRDWREIPCLPIGLFRRHDLRTGRWSAETTFESSGTTGDATSRHAIRSLDGYQRQTRLAFEVAVAPLAGYQLLALLPSYLERGGSGLVAMVDGFMPAAAPGSGYFLDDRARLRRTLTGALTAKQPVLLWGVSFALLDLLTEGPVVLPQGSLLLETGGMKGRRRELTREELHAALREGYTLAGGAPLRILSEYGMTELQSQGYALDGHRFRPTTTLRVLARDVTDPFAVLGAGRSGALNLYDLANADTCAFLASDDLGRVYGDGTFEVLGRLDEALVRGCSLLVGD